MPEKGIANYIPQSKLHGKLLKLKSKFYCYFVTLLSGTLLRDINMLVWLVPQEEGKKTMYLHSYCCENRRIYSIIAPSTRVRMLHSKCDGFQGLAGWHRINLRPISVCAEARSSSRGDTESSFSRRSFCLENWVSGNLYIQYIQKEKDYNQTLKTQRHYADTFV